jgi:hypothetical protein
MQQDERKTWTRSLRTVIIAAALLEAVGIALALWKSAVKG